MYRRVSTSPSTAHVLGTSKLVTKYISELELLFAKHPLVADDLDPMQAHIAVHRRRSFKSESHLTQIGGRSRKC